MYDLITKQDFCQTIDLIVAPVIIAHQEIQHLHFNKAFLSEIGYNLEEVYNIERWFEEAYPDPDYRRLVRTEWQERIERADPGNNRHVDMIAHVRRADGSYCWYHVHENNFGYYKVITFLNVDSLQQTNYQLQDILKQKDILLSIIAHDIRSPLATIRQLVSNYVQLDLSERELAEMFAQMGVQIDYIFNIINSLLVRTSAERGVFLEKYEHISLLNFFKKYQEYHNERLRQKNINFNLSLTGEEIVYYDSFILDMIIRNLIDNALKYSPDGGTIHISYVVNGEVSEITIRDEGPGMSAALKERILNNQANSGVKSQITDSFGLGLSLTKEILEKHGGALGLVSGPGRGTSFLVRLPNSFPPIH